jgi:hypothetical protein
MTLTILLCHLSSFVFFHQLLSLDIIVRVRYATDRSPCQNLFKIQSGRKRDASPLTFNWSSNLQRFRTPPDFVAIDAYLGGGISLNEHRAGFRSGVSHCYARCPHLSGSKTPNVLIGLQIRLVVAPSIFLR